MRHCAGRAPPVCGGVYRASLVAITKSACAQEGLMCHASEIKQVLLPNDASSPQV